MAGSEYTVRLTADTRQASEKLDAVNNTLSGLTQKNHNIKVNLDARAFQRASADAQEIANNIKNTKLDIREASGLNIISNSSLSAATTLAGQFYGIRKDIRGIEGDLGRALGKTNVSEFMRTEQFLERILDNSRSRTKEIVETYKNVREIPGTADLLAPVENFARAKAWESFGSEIADQTIRGVQQGLQQSVVETKKFFYADLFDEIGNGVSRTIDTLARLGLAIQGVQLLVGPLAATWSAAFDGIIGQNIRLEQTMLSTQTTLASTGKLISKATGAEVTDPLQKIYTLEGGVKQAISNIRIRSLDLAGVTSQQIIDIFGVVATSISQVNGDLKDAEDLAISFTAALGTLGIPFYQARQEIGSILGGYITEDSLLAKRLQISNKDIEQAKNSIDGVVGYLKKKLEIAVAGQSIQAKNFAGVASNIKEVFEVILQRLGAPLLKPLVAGMTLVYNNLKKIQGVVSEVSEYLSKVITKTIVDISGIFERSKLIQSIGQFINDLAAPYEQLARAVELGLGGRGQNLLEQWLSGTARIPAVMQGVVGALQAFGSFLKLQVALVTEPIIRLLDMTRERLSGFKGFVQAIPRATQLPFLEGFDAFTKGWDTLSSTISYAAGALAKFGIALIKLKITEITAGIRAAADVIELFGSAILGKINLAISFFDFLGNIASSDIAKFTVSMLAINKLVNSTEFFGLKGLTLWLIQLRPIVNQLIGDFKLFAQGFKDAGNIESLLGNVQGAYGRLFNLQNKSGNPVLQNSAQIEQMTQRIASLQAIQTQMAAQGAGAAAMERYSQALRKANDALLELKQTEQRFTTAQRAGAALKNLFGSGAEVAQAKEAARQASVLASGAATAQTLSGVMESLALKLGMTKEQFKTIGGAAEAATKSLQTFLTTSALVNIGFTVAALAISAGIAAWQQYEEAQKKASMSVKNLIAVQKILSSGYDSIIKAAQGGDVASQNLLATQRELAQAQYSSDTADINELVKRNSQLNDIIYARKTQLSEINRESGSLVKSLSQAAIYYLKLKPAEDELTKNKEKQAKLERQRFLSSQAIAKLTQEEQGVQDFKILAERRKDLEAKIARAREDYVKEVTDKEFQTRIELLNLEQQKRREMVEMEKAALAARYQQLINNSGEQEAKVLQIAQEYSAALLDGVAAEDQRRSELMQKQMQLQKEIEDYAFKMAREKINLEKEIGGYKKRMEEYLNRQQDLRIQKELTSLRSRAALLGSSYQPYNIEQQQKFINATQQPGREIDHRIAYAMMQVIPKQQLGLSGLEGGDVAVEKLVKALGNLPVTMTSLLTLIQQYTSGVGDPRVLAEKLVKDAERAFNSSRFSTKQSPADIEKPELDINWGALQQRIESAAASILQMFTQVQAANSAKNKQQLDLIRQRAEDPSSFTGIKADYTSEIDKSRTALRSFVDSLVDGTLDQITATKEINAIRQQLRAEIRALVLNYIKQDPSIQKAMQNYGVTAQMLIDTYSQGKSSIKTNAGEVTLGIPGLNPLAGARYRASQAAEQQVLANSDKANEVSQLERFRAALTDLANQSRQFEDERVRLVAELAGMVAGGDPVAKRIAEVEAQFAILESKFKEIMQNPEVAKAFKATKDNALSSAKALGNVERQAEDPVTSLIGRWKAELADTKTMVASLAQTIQSELGSAMSNAVNGVINGTMTVREAFGQMFANIGKAFIDMATQMIAKALILKVLGILSPGAAPGGGAGGLGSLFGAGAPEAVAGGGIFSGAGPFQFRAAGGPISAGRPYIVGERGPELVFPGSNGYVMPADRTAAALAQSRAALGGGGASAGAGSAFRENRDALSTATSMSRERQVERWLTSGAGSTEIKYSRVGSGDLPFVTEQDMLQATRIAAQEGAKLGQQRTLAALRNNPATRRSIGV